MARTDVARPDTGSDTGTGLCTVCGSHLPVQTLRPWQAIRPGLSDLIAREVPAWAEGCAICTADLARFRRQYVERLLARDRDASDDLDRQVIESLEAGEIVTRNPADELDSTSTPGQRIADRVTRFGGSWPFLLGFCAVMAFWIAINTTLLRADAFDPYPFILLNLVLSCVAAVQAPIILMSQSRQDLRDKIRAENDYRVNLKAELEIRQLSEMVDHQLMRQWEKLAELHRIQIDLLEDRADDRADNRA